MYGCSCSVWLYFLACSASMLPRVSHMHKAKLFGCTDIELSEWLYPLHERVRKVGIVVQEATRKPLIFLSHYLAKAFSRNFHVCIMKSTHPECSSVKYIVSQTTSTKLPASTSRMLLGCPRRRQGNLIEPVLATSFVLKSIGDLDDVSVSELVSQMG